MSTKMTDTFDSIITRLIENPNLNLKPQSLQVPRQQPTEKGKRYLQCSKGCGGEIYFDVNTKTKTGKWIPISKVTGLPHQCQ